jgi:hypothetical protein
MGLWDVDDENDIRAVHAPMLEALAGAQTRMNHR